MGVTYCLKITKLILLDICLNLTNLVLTFANIHLFYETGNSKFGNISLFLLWFPGNYNYSYILAQLFKAKLYMAR